MITITIIRIRELAVRTFRKRLFILILLASAFSAVQAQYSDAGLQIGVSRYKGELSPHLIDYKFIYPAGGIFYRHNWTRYWSWKIEANYAHVSGDDAEQSNEFEYRRNLNFFSDIYEITNTIEFNFLEYELGNRGYSFAPYIFTGFTAFYFNPKTEVAGQKVKLQEIGTEGQGLDGYAKPYHRISFAIPLGGGIKIGLGNVGVSFQISARRTYTDYLDDVSTTYPDMTLLQASGGALAVHLSDPSVFQDSTLLSVPSITGKQRGDSSENDWYVFGTVAVYIRLSSFIKEFCKPFKMRRYS